ncbi:MAG: CPBP family intramembrane metalloprotease [Myxococcales bacterium]|nr:CPBP family intramembrane metalloprotease [Myxococcales bacterium]
MTRTATTTLRASRSRPAARRSRAAGRADRPLLERIAPAWLARYWHATREPETVALAIAPLVLVYGVGLAHASEHARAGVDLVSGQLLRVLPATGYLALQIAIAGGLVLFAAVRSRATASFRERLVVSGPLVGEAIVYGLTLGGAILWLFDRLAALAIAPSPVLDRTVAAAGAGLYEELLFRLLLITVLVVLVRRAFDLPRYAVIGGAVVLSSLVFAAAHHLAGEPFALFPFAYRTVAGALFAGLFLSRGFAVAAWSHAAYDFYTLTLLAG